MIRNKKLLMLLAVLCLQACDTITGHVEHHPNGQVKLKGKLRNGLKYGEWLMYDSIGNKLRMTKYQSDSMIYREFFTKGKLTFTEEMKGNKKHGKTITYYDNGEVEGEALFTEGLQKGEQLFYFRGGALSSKYIEIGDGRIKEYYEYWPNGQLGVYAKSLENGVFNIYDSLGNRMYDLLYENAELVDTLKVY